MWSVEGLFTRSTSNRKHLPGLAGGIPLEVVSSFLRGQAWSKYGRLKSICFSESALIYVKTCIAYISFASLLAHDSWSISYQWFLSSFPFESFKHKRGHVHMEIEAPVTSITNPFATFVSNPDFEWFWSHNCNTTYILQLCQLKRHDHPLIQSSFTGKMP